MKTGIFIYNSYYILQLEYILELINGVDGKRNVGKLDVEKVAVEAVDRIYVYISQGLSLDALTWEYFAKYSNHTLGLIHVGCYISYASHICILRYA